MAKRMISNSSCRATVLDHGAHILSWHPMDGHEALFVTSGANPEAELHGGIPICAPWFALGRGDAPKPHKHGLVRYVDWDFVEARELRDATQLTWELPHSRVAHLPGADAYPADLHYRYEAVFGRELHVALTITSPTEPTVIDQALHTYFLVNNVRQATVAGLDGTQYRDTTVGDERGTHSGELAVAGHHDAIYFGGAERGPLTITLPDRRITVAAEGARDAVVWNPGPENAAALEDFAGDDWSRMLCVEVGNIQQHAVEIEAGGSHTLGLTIGVASRRGDEG